MKYIAIDLGASGGRLIFAEMVDDTLQLEEIYRFTNGPTVNPDGHLVWNVRHIFAQIIKGLKKAGEIGKKPDYIGIDTWAVDYALLDKNDRPIGPVYCYRDKRGEKAAQIVHCQVPFKTLYGSTGIQYQPFNTVYQLYDDRMSGRLKQAETFLLLPDYLNFLLTGVKNQEYTNMTATGLVNSYSHKIDEEIVTVLDYPRKLFTEIKQPGTVVGRLKPEIIAEIGYDATVALPATHDTASAVLSADLDYNQPYISSGTWSLLGIMSNICRTDYRSMEYNYSNEGSTGYNFRFQKNIMGLWVIQQVRHELGDEYSFAELVRMAHKDPTDKIININHKDFLSPHSMIEEIEKRTGDLTVGQLAYCVYHSLAISYKNALDELRELTGLKFDTLTLIGGGTQNRLLNEMTEKETGLKLLIGPKEGSAVGNLMMQMVASGEYDPSERWHQKVKHIKEISK